MHREAKNAEEIKLLKNIKGNLHSPQKLLYNLRWLESIDRAAHLSEKVF
jgi:hypothetical protein